MNLFNINKIISRLPYQQQKRRVIYESANNTSLHQEKPRNIIIQWEAPNPVIKKSQLLILIFFLPINFINNKFFKILNI